MMLHLGLRAHEDHAERRVLIGDRQPDDIAVESFLLFEIINMKSDMAESGD
jgi:hypothetical protein